MGCVRVGCHGVRGCESGEGGLEEERRQKDDEHHVRVHL